jgi:hypothetical protein
LDLAIPVVLFHIRVQVLVILPTGAAAKLYDMAWDPDIISQQFLAKAECAERYLDEVKAKVRANPSYQVIHDMTLAEFYVYNHLHGRTFLRTRETFVRYLEDLSAHPPISREAFDEARFAWFYSNTIRGVIERHTSG